MGKLKVAVCCTFGAGSSMMLKMNLDSVFNNMNLDADVEVHDISSISGVINELDAIYTSTALVPQIEETAEGTDAIIVPVVDYFNLGRLEELTREYVLKE